MENVLLFRGFWEKRPTFGHHFLSYVLLLKVQKSVAALNISDEFIGQGQMSKFKVTKLGNVIALTDSDFSDTTQFPGLWCDVMTSQHDIMTSYDVPVWHHYIVWCNINHPIWFYVHVCVSIHHGKRTFGQKDCTWGERGRYVNAQAFSSDKKLNV